MRKSKEEFAVSKSGEDKTKALAEKENLEKEQPFSADLSNLSPCEKAVYEFISKEKTTADIIGRELKLEQSKVLSALTMLEINELIISLPGGAYEAVTK